MARQWCSVSMASLISKRSAHANMMQRYSSTPSTFSRSTAKTSADCRLARGKPTWIVCRRVGQKGFVAPFEQGEIGPDLFRAACKMELEAWSRTGDIRAYRCGRCTHWIKVENPASLAMNRAAEIDWSR